jgi:hypothetical protein
VDQIAVSSAGSAAEELFGCPNHDLASFSDLVRISNLLEAHGIAEEDDRASSMRDRGYSQASTLLQAHRRDVIRLAERLLEFGEVTAEQFHDLIGQ